MPRIYAQNESHEIDWAQLAFVEGVAAVPAGTNTAWFEVAARHYTVDGSKNHLELWDGMTVAQLDAFYAWLGGTVSADDTKAQKVRKIETSLSAKYIGTLTIASAAATAGAGKTKITITDPGTATYYFKTAKTTAAALLYGDEPDSTWTKMTLTEGVQDEIAPGAADHDKVTVVRVTAAGTVDALKSANLTVKVG